MFLRVAQDALSSRTRYLPKTTKGLSPRQRRGPRDLKSERCQRIVSAVQPYGLYISVSPCLSVGVICSI